MVNVALVKGNESYDTVRRALELIKDEVRVPRSKPVLVKPNLVSARSELYVTPVAGVRAVLDFLKEKGVKKFLVGDGSAEGADTMDVLKKFGYAALKNDYDVELVDLNKDKTIEGVVFGGDLKPMRLRISRTLAESYLVSVARMKTHDTVIATLAIKNIGVGSVVHGDRSCLSHAYPAMNLSLARMNLERPPHLSIVDGVVGLEGAGPVAGTPKPTGVAVASVDSLAADIVAAQVMGYKPTLIGYLYYLMEMQGVKVEDVQVLGARLEECVTRYKDHPAYRDQLKWQVADWQRIIKSNP
jgi:uncharacterized protein (DUF362 family)